MYNQAAYCTQSNIFIETMGTWNTHGRITCTCTLIMWIIKRWVEKIRNSLIFDKQVNEVNSTGYVLDLLDLGLAGADVTLICDGVNSIC